MYQQIMWYVDDNRFSNIVKQIEQSAAFYEENYSPDSPNNKKAKNDFYSLINYHAVKSGYILKLKSSDIVSTLVPGGKIDRKALDTFEKEIIKNHMYQKHLWEFMGTTGSFGIITKLALANNKKSLFEVLPFSYRQEQKTTSPIQPILDDINEAVPIYIYFDNSMSTLYDKNRAGAAFDTTLDRSGFNWDMSGYDPNYTFSGSTQVDIVYDRKKDCFVPVSRNLNNIYMGPFELFPRQNPIPLEIKITKTKDKVILHDPYHIYLFKLIDLSAPEDRDEYIDSILKSIDFAIKKLSIDKITYIVKYPLDEDDKELKKKYADILGKRAEKFDFISIDKAYEEIKKASCDYKEIIIDKKGVELASKLDYITELGLVGEGAEKAIMTSMAPAPLSYDFPPDLEAQALDEEDINYITSLSVPEDKKSEFNHTLFNLLRDYSFISASITPSELADKLCAKIKGEGFVDQNVSISATISRILASKSSIFDSEKVDEKVRDKVQKAFAEVPDLKKTKKLIEAIDNIPLRFKLINKLNGMSEQEVVNAAVTIFYDNFAPTSTIKYIRGSDPVNQMLYFQISLDELMEKERKNKNEYYSQKPIDFSLMKKTSKYNIFAKDGAKKWLSSANGKKSSLSPEALERIVASFSNSQDFDTHEEKLYPLTQSGIPTGSSPIIFTPTGARIRIMNFFDPQGSLDIESSPVKPDEQIEGYNITRFGITPFACNIKKLGV